MEQDELISSIENSAPQSMQQEAPAPSQQEITPIQQINPLPEDIAPKKNKRSIFDTFKIIAYAILGISAAFLLILFILGFI
ncbi:MAG: hypothetical protein PHT91_03595 [Candidatus Nanoarchaeia archaeon]|nr:hypothetical protein [Candidatus Nanoarchaeia archaeon]MDD5054306.1 hypothetical protein [Candidatus Nanoarchaeia archaeon]MDD5499928.1 hypothetical protein [Candidatus Nanoarchaeia archaeon]